MLDLVPFALSDMVAASAALRTVCEGGASMEEAANGVVDYLFEQLVDKSTGEPACALVRFYKAHPCDRLPPDLQEAAQKALADADEEPSSPQCLALLASAGIEPEWNDRRASRRHRAMPLPSVAALERLPMVAAVLGQFGLDPSAVVAPRAAVDGTGSDRSFDVFHVADAVGSPLIPDQDDFVVPYAIRSVIGFGGVLPSGSAFAVVLFTTVAVPRESASMFAPLALSVKVGILPFDDGRVFDDEPCAEVATTERSLRSQVAALTQLIEVRERLVGAQTAQLEAAFATLEERSAQLSDALSALAISEARHEALMEASIDAVITMDHEGRVLGFNPAASRIFGYEQEAALGQPLDDLVIPPRLRPNHREGLRNYLRDGVGPILGRHIEQTGMRADGSEFPVELTVTAMEVPGAPPAFAATVRDISVEKETRGRLKEAREHSARVARTLQESLLPPRLPALPGVELASRYHPAGDGSEIGGDFYDVFETAKHDWGLVIGDVCGKGAEAAALTALARYTLRAAAMRIRRPSAVLAMLNEAILLQQPDRYCTVVYTRLRRIAGVMRLTIACGGHPRPLLIDGAGGVTPVGGEGMLVGALPDAHFADATVDLLAGQTLVGFTDGVTEARHNGEFFGDQRLRQLLGALGAAPAEEVAETLLRAVLDFQAGHASDDLAVVVLRNPGGPLSAPPGMTASRSGY